ncbi:hypothetical protein SAMN04488029_2782 [Reichenbachiella faecimaris]|uniref:Uncharacterized protein n=1 Tax=Reichenbachiella faecimaris TaxID=692418 RepID=A0A1W2GHU7_REIFA|nr:hypothetical protein SAMN04488029_2782 [Reichenbachiella faecimaris]
MKLILSKSVKVNVSFLILLYIQCSKKLDVMSEKKKVVQVKNPKTGRYVKIDREKGRIVAHKKSDGPFKNVAVARKRS